MASCFRWDIGWPHKWWTYCLDRGAMEGMESLVLLLLGYLFQPSLFIVWPYYDEFQCIPLLSRFPPKSTTSAAARLNCVANIISFNTPARASEKTNEYSSLLLLCKNRFKVMPLHNSSELRGLLAWMMMSCALSRCDRAVWILPTFVWRATDSKQWSTRSCFDKSDVNLVLPKLP